MRRSPLVSVPSRQKCIPKTFVRRTLHAGCTFARGQRNREPGVPWLTSITQRVRQDCTCWRALLSRAGRQARQATKARASTGLVVTSTTSNYCGCVMHGCSVDSNSINQPMLMLAEQHGGVLLSSSNCMLPLVHGQLLGFTARLRSVAAQLEQTAPQ